jgi:CRP-like cAMP-binding protein
MEVNRRRNFMAEIVDVLAQHLFFVGLDPITLRILAGCAGYERFEQGEWIMRQGSEADRFYLVYSGRVSLEFTSPKCGTVILETLADGDILGASWMFEPYRCHWDARALEPTYTLAFNAKCLRAICEDDHDIGYELMKRFSSALIKRLQEARLKCSDIYNVCAK